MPYSSEAPPSLPVASPASSLRFLRCSSSPAARLAERTASVRVASLQRPTPPAASRLEHRLLLPQLSHCLQLHRVLGARIDVVVQRPVVEEADQHERAHREPATGDRSTEAPAALPGRSHPARVLQQAPRSCGEALL